MKLLYRLFPRETFCLVKGGKTQEELGDPVAGLSYSLTWFTYTQCIMKPTSQIKPNICLQTGLHTLIINTQYDSSEMQKL